MMIHFLRPISTQKQWFFAVNNIKLTANNIKTAVNGYNML